MNFKELDNETEIKTSYRSLGEDGLAKAFITPSLKCATLYQRSVGYFSSGVLDYILDGIVSIHRRKGKIQLIASPFLSADDIEAINLGYSKREIVAKDAFSRDFSKELYNIKEDRLNLLVELIASGTLDIKIVVTKTTDGNYHDKFGILYDEDGNRIVFFGSPNSSANGYGDNYEKIRLVKSWVLASQDSVNDEENEFKSLWENTNEFLDVYDYKESAKENILKVVEEKSKASKKTDPVKLRKYQEDARDAWVRNNYKGFFVMATGTGKTWTAIFSAKKLLEEHKASIVICAPYKHLVKQWYEDVRKMFPEAKIIMVSSENPRWEQEISHEVINKKYNPDDQLIIISTIASFKMERFKNVFNKSPEDKLLIVDEAHRFTCRTDEIKNTYKYMIGLSATPYSGSSSGPGKELMEFFGGEVFSLPIEKALGKYLVNYYYHPIYVYATAEEESLFAYHTQKMMACFRNGVLVDYETFIKHRRSRLRVISMADEKTKNIDSIINKVNNKNNFVVYCGDGKLFDNNTGEEIRHIQSIKQKLFEHDLKASQFTAKESMSDRMELVDAFNKGEIAALAAIRCLDEGINIPSIRSALILSSNDDYREFVQRRGRILRQYGDKEYADIYDVVVLPSTGNTTWAKIEFRRFYEYAKLSINWNEELEAELNSKMAEYGVSLEDIGTFEYDDVEEPLDE